MATSSDDTTNADLEPNFDKSEGVTTELSAEEKSLEALASELPQQYEVFNKVSEGGMGAIYKARNRYTKAFSAIKVMRAESDVDEIALQRFIVEAKSASLLNHPNICRVNDFGLTTTNRPYLVMDWIDGISLGAKIQRDLRIAPAEAVTIFKQVATALEHAHQNKVVHRDLKPENIMLTRTADGTTVSHLVDFGIAKVLDETDLTPLGLTQTGVVVGTPLYMSPEQATGGEIDGRTDIYCFGCVMYFVLSGKPPFLGPNFIATINKHLTQAPPEFAPNLKISDNLRLIVFRCMEKKPSDRYQTAAALSADLRNLSLGQNIDVAKLASTRKLEKKRLVTAGFFIVGFIVMYLLSIWMQDFLDAASTKPKPAVHTVEKKR
ncbi:MAG: serine/threonine-protein kinase [Candidatus Obscuribacterales bacterium]|nr:serine/threonine-protein kinase [Candidatus Obscuribacterales bacterium]